ncbi:MAG: restriction endonuclease subunit R, partial [Thermoplasmata archaeon]
FLVGKDIKRYSIENKGRYLILIPSGWTNKNRAGKDAWKWFSETYPAIANHLAQFEEKAKKRWDKGEYWWELRSCDYYEEFEKPKIMYLVFQVRPAFTFDDKGQYGNNAVWIIPRGDKYLLGILNSKTGWYLISKYCTQIQNGYQLIFKYLGKIPIRTIDFSNPEDRAKHDKMVGLVERMLELHERLARARTENEKTMLQRQIDATDGQIDKLVYELYELTPEEIEIIEKFNEGK